MKNIPRASVVSEQRKQLLSIGKAALAFLLLALSAECAEAETSETQSTTKTPSTAMLPNQVQQAYAAGNMDHAMHLLAPWLKAHPTDAYAHYLQANCLLKQKQYPEASYEYARAEQLSPKSKIAEYCRTAQVQITSLQSTSARVDKRQVVIENAEADDDDSSTATASASESIPTSQRRDSTKAPLRNGAAVPPGTLELIRKQSEMAQRSAAARGAAEAANERLKAATEVKSLQEKAERLAGHTRTGSEPIALSPEERERLRSQSALSGERLKEIGELKAAEAEEGYRYKADEIQRQADHLQELLLDPSKGGTKLNPVGTNLYIRNYAKPPEPVLKTNVKMRSLEREVDIATHSQHTSVKLRDRNTHPGDLNSNGASGSGQAETHVRGEVLDK